MSKALKHPAFVTITYGVIGALIATIAITQIKKRLPASKDYLGD